MLFAAYALSFVTVGIHWSHHHNVLQATRRVNGRALLANPFFPFWLSLISFGVRWVGEAGITHDTVIVFGVLMLLCFFSFALPLFTLLQANDADAPFAKAVKRAQGPDHGGCLHGCNHVGSPLANGGRYDFCPSRFVWLIPDNRFDQFLE
ncbi:MAG: TMEM175 family protein [Sphingomicrobium sp.]